jgi:hypothetical protein
LQWQLSEQRSPSFNWFITHEPTVDEVRGAQPDATFFAFQRSND